MFATRISCPSGLAAKLVAWGTTVVALASLAPRLEAQTAPFHYVWAGQVHDSFTLDGGEYWTAEDGGRIRHRASATSGWTFQATQSQVREQLRRIFFLSDHQTGWAVGDNGWFLHTTNGGSSTWTGVQIDSPPNVGDEEHSNLYDVRFFDASHGWLLGEHGLWITDNGGALWTLCTLMMQDGHVLDYGNTNDQALLNSIEFYKFDLVDRGQGTIFGMACAEPGLVFRTTDGVTWKVVFDIRCLCTSCSICYDCNILDLPRIQVPYGPLDDCAIATGHSMCDGTLPFDAWDVEISRNPDSKLAVMVGGVGNTCGLAFSTTDDGDTWSKDSHECMCTNTQNGCLGDCSQLPDYHYSDTAPVHYTFHNQSFPTLYGVGVFSTDNVAIASGYGGSIARRNSSGVWQDKSVVTDHLHLVDPTTQAMVNMPLSGTMTDGTSGQTGKAMVTGYGGTMRETTDGGQTWNDAADLSQQSGTVPHSAPWRIKDILFQDENHGWEAGQFGRIGVTTDGGRTFTTASTPTLSSTNGPNLTAIVSDPSVTRGVAVANSVPPRIIYGDLTIGGGGGTTWSEGSVIATGLGVLNAACWAGTSTFWAAGNGASIVKSTNNGATWRQVQFQSNSQFDITGVAFVDLNNGIFVGTAMDSAGLVRGGAYAYHWNGTSVVWTALFPSDTSISFLNRVAFGNSAAYVIGEANSLISNISTRVGVVLKSSYSNGTFGPLVEYSPPPSMPQGFIPCFDEPDAGRILTDVAVDPGGNLWVGAQCGSIWELPLGSSTWNDFQSQTGTHILGISFLSTTNPITGFFGGTYNGGPKKPSHSIVKYKP